MIKKRILFANCQMNNRTGTEILVRNYAVGMKRRGHIPIVYSPLHGELIDELRDAGIECISSMADLVGSIDLIHGHHFPSTLTAAAAFPSTPIIYFCHDYTSWLDEPPRLPQILRYVAVDRATQKRLTQDAKLPPDRVGLLLNAVDIEHFKSFRALSDKPRKALAFAKNKEHVNAITTACAARQIEVTFIGGAVDNIVDDPAIAMNDCDLVFASALSAMEAMAMGRAVIVCDGRGVAGFCTPQRFNEWREQNFGLFSFKWPPVASQILYEIDLYDPNSANRVTQMLRSEGGLERQYDRLIALYDEILIEAKFATIDAASSRVAILKMMEAWSPPFGSLISYSQRRNNVLSVEHSERLRHGGLQRVRLGCPDSVLFSAKEVRRWWSSSSGFSACEETGRWTDGPVAEFSFDRPSHGSLRLDITYHPFMVENVRETIIFSVEIDGQFKSYSHDWGAQLPEVYFELPPATAATASEIKVKIKVNDLVSPQQLHISNDSRLLGLYLTALTITPPKSE
jgi:Glycosyltransferase Family 4